MGFSLEKYVFRLVTSVERERILTVPMRNRTSDLRITRSNILPLSHRDSVVSVVYFKYLLRFSLVCMISLVFHSLIG